MEFLKKYIVIILYRIVSTYGKKNKLICTLKQKEPA